MINPQSNTQNTAGRYLSETVRTWEDSRVFVGAEGASPGLVGIVDPVPAKFACLVRCS